MGTFYKELLGKSWDFFISAIGTTTLGFIIPSVAVPLVGFALVFLVAFVREGRGGVMTHLKKTFALAAVVAFAGEVVVWLFVFGGSVLGANYQEQTKLASALTEYKDEVSPHCWLKNIGMKPPTALPNGQRSGNLVVFFCNTEYEAPLSIEWDFSSPHPRKIGVPFFPDNRALNQNVVTYGDDHIVSFIEAPNLAKFQPTLLEVFSDKSIPPQVYKVEIRRMEKDKAVTPIEIKADDLR
jgi:hypothetical protein